MLLSHAADFGSWVGYLTNWAIVAKHHAITTAPSTPTPSDSWESSPVVFSLQERNEGAEGRNASTTNEHIVLHPAKT